MVNYLAGFLLTRELLPLLRRSAPARIVNVASIGQHPLDFADLMTDEALATTTGRFYDRTRETRANAQAYDPAARAELWSRSLELVGHADIGWELDDSVWFTRTRAAFPG